MAAGLMPQLRTIFFDANGIPLAGGKLFTYAAGTSTPKATFTDATAAGQNTNPVILDADGGKSIWLSAEKYKFVLKSPTDVVLGTWDQVSNLYDQAVATFNLADGSVTQVKIANNSVSTAKLQDSAVTTGKIADGSVTLAKLPSGVLTADVPGRAKMADGYVNTAKILDANVTTAKILDANVTTAKILDANVTTAKIANLAVNAAKIATNAITLSKLDTAAYASLPLSGSASNSGFSTLASFTLFGVPANRILHASLIPNVAQTITVPGGVVLTVRVSAHTAFREVHLTNGTYPINFNFLIQAPIDVSGNVPVLVQAKLSAGAPIAIDWALDVLLN